MQDCRNLPYGRFEMKAGFIMISKLVSTASAAALAIIFSMPAQAGEIDVAGTTGSLTFTAAGMNTLEVSSLLGFSGIAFYMSDSPSSGVASFGSLDFFTGPEVAGIFTAIPPANQLFSYESFTGPDPTPDSLTVEIAWDQVVANAPLGEPQLVGTGLVTFSDGDDTFIMDFPVGGGINITANFPLAANSPCDLTQLAMGSPSCLVTFEIASFEGDVITPGAPPLPPTGPPPQIEVPEPISSFTALGIALCCLWGRYQLTRRERGRSMSSVS
jgi:hypothetical protein